MHLSSFNTKQVISIEKRKLGEDLHTLTIEWKEVGQKGTSNLTLFADNPKAFNGVKELTTD